MKLKPKTRAWQVLLEKIAEKKQGPLAKKAKVSQGGLSLIAARKRFPSRLTITRLVAVGIQAQWWFEPPAGGESSGRAA